MAEEKKTATTADSAVKKETAAKPAAKTTAKAPTKTVQRLNKQQEQPKQREEIKMTQQALGMVETRGLVAAIEAADAM